MKKPLLFALLSFVFSQSLAQVYQAPVFDDATRTEKVKALLPTIDKIYKEYAEQKYFPGFSFGIMMDGKLIHSGSVGYTDLAKKTPADAQSMFRIASMSKSFTTMAILQLRDAGKIQLDDRADKYIPEMKKIKPLTSDAPIITIRHLLTHAAGFPEDNPWGDRQLADTNAELLKLVEGVQFSNVPGVAYEYSNLGITLLGYIIQKISGQPYQTYINQHILQPLGMTHTKWEYAEVPSAKLAHGYRWIDGQWVEEALLHDGAYGAMGGLITSIEDFAKYVAFHQSAWPPSNKEEYKVLKRSSLREMHQPWNISSFNTQYKYPSGRSCAIVSAYCYGLNWLRDCQNRVYVGHSGGLPGFGSHWRFLPEYGIAVMAFSNLTYAPTTQINMQALDTLIVSANLKPYQLPASSILKQRQNELMTLLPHWKFSEKSTLFAENFFADYSPESLRKEATDIFERVGKVLKVNEIKPENQLRGSFLIEAERGQIEISFTLTPEHAPLIQEYHIREVK